MSFNPGEFNRIRKQIDQAQAVAKQIGLVRHQAGRMLEGVRLAVDAKRIFPGGLPAIRRLFEIHQKSLRVAEVIKKSREREEEVLASLAPRGWLISMSLPANAPDVLHALLMEKGIEAVETQLLEELDAEFCRSALEPCFGRPSFHDWEANLRLGLTAHAREEYALAIPMWLMAIDGIARLELAAQQPISNVYGVIKRKKGLASIKSQLAVGWASDPLLQALLEVWKLVAGSDQAPVAPEPIYTRDEILHGADPNFASRKYSLQLILMLEALHYFLTTADEARTEADS